ncbi:bacillithiol biosynthesis cysteine-adding enzyme BshC [Lentibacillus saliphilus]|uniref:bacillithiol biosynthesis cysteine-adding enzyme BshC n=1 Tax=Lentibacillus saliphilus TaxID=2737028 RepID=UPI001C30D78E|nr:bacillithiol biosynthesis cysteine-adding enzyme BshC [Lentibacillus saliphilus]
MEINSIQLEPSQRFLSDYYKQTDDILSHFQYNPFQDTTYRERLKALQSRDYSRIQLSETLYEMNAKWGAPKATLSNIERLKDEDSVVVIAGQQAGLLTGPLYTINKIISVIQFAKDQEEKQSVPVIPVFWIAGEDHDFAEINHIFMPNDNEMKKVTIGQYIQDKTPVSDITLDQGLAKKWLDNLFECMSETEHTKDLYRTIEHCLLNATSYVDFFARIIYCIFPDTGVILLDSGDKALRQLESDYFIQLIHNQPTVAQGVHETVEQLKQKGYELTLDTTPFDGHLFYHKDQTRSLLMRDPVSSMWTSKLGDIQLTTEELLNVAKFSPERLSNNVVSRPLMQEWLFPTLAFLGGPGELAYWSALKPAFAACHLSMPPVLPRQSYTFVNRHIERLLRKHHINAQEAITNGVSEQKINWLAAQQNPPIKDVVNEIKRTVDSAHRPLRDIAENMQPDMKQLAHKNLQHLNKTLDFIEKRMSKALEEKYAHTINEFDLINMALRPNNQFQERIWSPLPLMNEYGIDFIQSISQQSWSMMNKHFVVYL